MFNKERKERCIKREKKLSKNDNKKKSTHNSKAKRKNGNWNTHVYASWSFVRKLCLQVECVVCVCLFTIECVRLTSSNSQIQNKRATKGFILIRHKRYQIYTCLQLSSSIASFVWKPAHFELRSYGGAWHNTKIAFVEKYTLISWYLPISGVKVSGKVLF